MLTTRTERYYRSKERYYRSKERYYRRAVEPLRNTTARRQKGQKNLRSGSTARAHGTTARPHGTTASGSGTTACERYKKNTSVPTSAEQNTRFWSGAVLPLRSCGSTALELYYRSGAAVVPLQAVVPLTRAVLKNYIRSSPFKGHQS